MSFGSGDSLTDPRSGLAVQPGESIPRHGYLTQTFTELRVAIFEASVRRIDPAFVGFSEKLGDYLKPAVGSDR
ncbi:MAG TPA: hypothetical protein VHC22_16130 [Pirellulales bacterium]|nr:hypothetical protein [Pirellulales bacterium]